jgi:hypothetical protein
MIGAVGSSQDQEDHVKTRVISTVCVALVLALTLGIPTLVPAQQPPPPPPAPPGADEGPTADDRTPPRLSYTDGQVSFWRPGAPDWVAAQINTALAPGDELSTGSPGNFEVQVGARAYVRAWGGTSLGLVNQDPDFLQIKVTAGHAALDLRTLDAGRAVEIDTPNAAITIEQTGYYRVSVQGDRTVFISRRGGRAIVTPASGQAASIASSEEVIIDGIDTSQMASYAAPPLDSWDQWNYARTDYLGEAVSARYVSASVYGASDLDRYGRWRTVSDYGSVWVPTSVPSGWAPYSTGSWTWDPYYGWTWVDTAPWGWAPFHYGRWVFVDSYWAWTPGPVLVRPAYAPALVAFFGGGPSVRVGWVALGWGEPCIPWWGRPRFAGQPWWGGWGGPRVVNNVVINRTTVVNVQNINVYRNAGVRNAVVAVDHQRFGRGPIAGARIAQVEHLEPVRGKLDVKPVPASLAPTTVRGARPSDDKHERRVVATRPPKERIEAAVVEPGARGRGPDVTPSPRIVPAPKKVDGDVETPRPPFGRGQSERPKPPPPPRLGGAQPRTPELSAPSPRSQSAAPEGARTPPRIESPRREAPSPADTPKREAPARVETPKREAPVRVETREAPARVETPRAQPPRVETPRPAPPKIEAPRPQASSRTDPPRAQPTPRIEAPRAQSRPLPGEAADRMSPGRGGDTRPRPDARQPNGGDQKKGRD